MVSRSLLAAQCCAGSSLTPLLDVQQLADNDIIKYTTAPCNLMHYLLLPNSSMTHEPAWSAACLCQPSRWSQSRDYHCPLRLVCKHMTWQHICKSLHEGHLICMFQVANCGIVAHRMCFSSMLSECRCNVHAGTCLSCRWCSSMEQKVLAQAGAPLSPTTTPGTW